MGQLNFFALLNNWTCQTWLIDSSPHTSLPNGKYHLNFAGVCLPTQLVRK